MRERDTSNHGKCVLVHRNCDDYFFCKQKRQQQQCRNIVNFSGRINHFDPLFRVALLSPSQSASIIFLQCVFSLALWKILVITCRTKQIAHVLKIRAYTRTSVHRDAWAKWYWNHQVCSSQVFAMCVPK